MAAWAAPRAVLPLRHSVQLHDNAPLVDHCERHVGPGTLIDQFAGMRRADRVSAIVCLCGLLLGSAHDVVAGHGAPVPIEERARGAERVAVGRVTAVTPAWQVNEFGDRLIVSTVHLTVDEHHKGPAASNHDY